MINYQEVLDRIHLELMQIEDIGEVASYIPELANVQKNNFGIYLNRVKGENFHVGDTPSRRVNALAGVPATFHG